MTKASAQYYVDFSWYLWLKNPPRLTTPQKLCGFLFGKIESPALYIVKGKVQQKPFAGRDIEWEDTQGFGKLPTREIPVRRISSKRGFLRKGYPFPMLAAEEASGKWVLICCACSLLKTRKGRERNGKEAKNQRRANRGKKSSVSRVTDTWSYNAIRQDALSFYGKLRWKPKPAPQSFAAYGAIAYWSIST